MSFKDAAFILEQAFGQPLKAQYVIAARTAQIIYDALHLDQNLFLCKSPATRGFYTKICPDACAKRYISSPLHQQFAGFLQLVQSLIDAAMVQQLSVATNFDNLSLIEHHNLIGFADGAEPVSNDNRGACA